jgi:hypothetical protein
MKKKKKKKPSSSRSQSYDFKMYNYGASVVCMYLVSYTENIQNLQLGAYEPYRWYVVA